MSQTRPATELVPARMLNEHVCCPRLAYLEWVQGECSLVGSCLPDEMNLLRRERVSMLRGVLEIIDTVENRVMIANLGPVDAQGRDAVQFIGRQDNVDEDGGPPDRLTSGRPANGQVTKQSGTLLASTETHATARPR